VFSAASLSELLFPTRCLGCRQLGIRICSQCRSFWHPHIYRSTITVGARALPVYSSVIYSSVAQKVLLGSKESALIDADQLIRLALSHALSYFNGEIGMADVVPVPSRKSAIRKRGRDFLLAHTEYLAEASGVQLRPVLIHRRKVADQTRLSAVEREANLTRAFTCANRGRIGNIPVIIIDDLMTSGATLREAARALFDGGYRPLGAVTACVAQPLRYTQ
jgi:predicted amidophosphoribosyltransferase